MVEHNRWHFVVGRKRLTRAVLTTGTSQPSGTRRCFVFAIAIVVMTTVYCLLSTAGGSGRTCSQVGCGQTLKRGPGMVIAAQALVGVISGLRGSNVPALTGGCGGCQRIFRCRRRDKTTTMGICCTTSESLLAVSLDSLYAIIVSSSSLLLCIHTNTCLDVEEQP